jgi:hypothetical protein
VEPLLSFSRIAYFLEFEALQIGLAAYAFGGVPAIATGIVAGLFHRRLFNWRGYLFIGVLGGVLSFAFAVAASGPSTFEALDGSSTLGVRANLGMLAIFFPSGFFAGAICARLRFGPPNNSFKPKPLRGSA